MLVDVSGKYDIFPRNAMSSVPQHRHSQDRRELVPCYVTCVKGNWLGNVMVKVRGILTKIWNVYQLLSHREKVSDSRCLPTQTFETERSFFASSSVPPHLKRISPQTPNNEIAFIKSMQRVIFVLQNTASHFDQLFFVYYILTKTYSYKFSNMTKQTPLILLKCLENHET